ncbi:hypothetical protein CCHR01_10125 [Colletotrichum chrysophilum]|uniref:Uncharacterized protein n=1 Tax=Colletotrichum chrysophilum TaxID=1836956 RepID=A0AAD9AFL2_9PEZI|nr:hypothetical protein CCHR01_10125 [Colletotrichum chrysophilum]
MSEEQMVSGRTQPDDVDCAQAISSLSLRTGLGTFALDELPPELIFMICSFLRPIRPMHEVFASRATYDFGTVYDTLQHDWRTVERLSVTNRRLRRCIADSGCLYRTIIVKGDSIWRVVSLLWSLKKNPAMGPAVRMLYMGLAFEVYPKEGSLPPPQQWHLDFVLEMATACNVQYPAALSFSTAPFPSDSLHCEWTSLLARVILAKMPSIEDIGIKIISRVFRGTEPPSTSLFKGLILPNLRSVAVRLENCSNWPLLHLRGGLWFCHDFDLVVDLSPVRNLYVEAEGLPLYMTLSPSHFSGPKFQNLTNITLNGCPVNEQELARMLDHCTLVSVFRYIMSHYSVFAIAPGIVIQALQRRHAKSLRTLCIHVFSRIWGLGEISTLESFDNLQSLWIDLGSIDNSNIAHGLVEDETGNGNDPSWGTKILWIGLSAIKEGRRSQNLRKLRYIAQ